MYDVERGDPIFYFKKVTQLDTKRKKYNVLIRGVRTMHYGVGSKQFVSTCWRRVSLITTQSRPSIMKRDQHVRAKGNNDIDVWCMIVMVVKASQCGRIVVQHYTRGIIREQKERHR
jgi:hypothetical protein